MKIEQLLDETLSHDPVNNARDRRSRLIRLPEVMKRVGLSRSAIYKRMAEKRFPKSRSLGPKCAVWVEEEIDNWISSIASHDAHIEGQT